MNKRCQPNESNSLIQVSFVDLLYTVFLMFSLINIFIHDKTFFYFPTIFEILLLLIYYIVRFFKKKNIIIYGLIIFGIIQSFIVATQIYGLVESKHSLFTITGTFGSPGQLGGYLSAIIILLLYTSDNKKIKATAVSFLLLLLFFYILVLTDSRASLLAIIVGIITIYSNFVKRIIKKTSYYIVGLLIFLLLFSGTIFLYNYREGSANARLLIWRVSWDIIKEKPVLGHGINSFDWNYMLYQAKYFEKHPDSRFLSVAENVSYPYNEFIHIIIEQGIIGGIIILAIIIALFCYSPRSKLERIARASLMALCVFSLFSYTREVPPLLFLFPILLGMCGSKTIITISPKLNWKIIQILLVILITSLGIKKILFMDKTTKNLNTILMAPDIASIRFIENHYDKLKHNKSFTIKYGVWLETTDNLEQKLKLPPKCETYCDIGKTLIRLNRNKEAEYYYITANQMIPTRMTPNYLLWKLYLEENDVEKAIEQAQKILKQPLKVEYTTTLRIKAEVRNFLKTSNN